MTATINKPNGSGVNRILKATRCSLSGYMYAWRFESAFRQESILVIILIPLSFFLAQSFTHWYFLITTSFLILLAELLNSAIEALADRITTAHDEMIKRAKDIGSAAVFTTLALAFIVWSHSIYLFFK